MMGLYDNFPYTNLHELNTDWIVKHFGDIEQAKQSAEASAASALESKEAAADSQESAALSQEAAAQSATDAETAAQNIINHMNDIDVLKSHSLDWINAIDYGFVNDGLTANDNIMADFITNDSDKVLYFPNGNYKFTAGFDFPVECHLYLDPKARLFLDSAEIQDYFITIRKESTRSDYTTTSFIKGGIIDAQYNASNVIGFRKCNTTNILSDCIINGVQHYGIVTNASEDKTPDGSMTIKNIRIENTKDVTETEQTGTTGIRDNGFDTFFDNIEIVNMVRAIYTISGRFTKIKAWIRSRNLLDASEFAFLDGYSISFDDIAIDTYRKGFRTATAGYGAAINNALWIRNNNVYTESLQTSYPQTIFNGTYPDKVFSVTNMKIQYGANLSFMDNNMWGYSTFTNITMLGGSNKISDLSGYPGSYERSILKTTVQRTTDAYGQISLGGTIQSVYVAAPLRCVCVKHGSFDDGTFKVYQIPDGGGGLTVLSSTAVTLKITYDNSQYSINGMY